MITARAEGQALLVAQVPQAVLHCQEARVEEQAVLPRQQQEGLLLPEEKAGRL
jgi:hypothetical protein